MKKLKDKNIFVPLKTWVGEKNFGANLLGNLQKMILR